MRYTLVIMFGLIAAFACERSSYIKPDPHEKTEEPQQDTLPPEERVVPFEIPSDFSVISEHPRLFLKRGEEVALAQTLAKPGNSHLVTVHDYIVSFCDVLMSKPVISRSWNGSMLNVAREALKRIFYLSYMYRYSGDEKFAARAQEEMLALSKFADWNPSHYLDTGEAQMALAIGFDWCYDYMAPSVRRSVAKAIMDKGFWQSFAARGTTYWTTINNWNPVCIGGSICAALAIYELYPDECRQAITHDIPYLKAGMEWYEPDGTYREGYTYWGYGTSYEVLTAEAFESALGHNLGQAQNPAYARSALFRLFTSTPTFGVFSFADSSINSTCGATEYWFANHLRNSSLIWESKRQLDAGNINSDGEDRFFPAMIIRASKSRFDTPDVPKEHFYCGGGVSPVFIWREGWESKEDCYLGVKGGCPTTTHAHMDVGMFFYENKGVRWAADPGSQSYGAVNDMLNDQSQNGKKWLLFRYGPDGHNIVRFGSMNQNVNSSAAITETWQNATKKGCSIDLSDTYAGQASGMTRKVWVDACNNLFVTDSFTSLVNENMIWNMITCADASVVPGGMVALSSSGHSATLECDFQGARSFTMSASTGNSYDPANQGMTRTGFIIPVEQGHQYAITVKLTIND